MSQSDQLKISQEFIKNFWPNQDISPGAIAAYHKEDKDFGWLEEVQTILCANQAKDLSDAELFRCTESCVCGSLLFHLGIIFREADGMLTVPEREEEEEEMNTRDLQIVRMCSYENTKLVENTFPSESEAKEIRDAARDLGRLGGLAKSEAKAISSRENGKKGGRPKKVRREETIEESNLDLFK